MKEPSFTSDKERRTSHMNEVLWVLVAFLLVLTFFNVSLWPLVRYDEWRKKDITAEASEGEKAKSCFSSPAKSTKLIFTLEEDDHVLYEGKLIDRSTIEKLFSEFSDPDFEVEIVSSGENMIALFYKCYCKNISPLVRFKPKDKSKKHGGKNVKDF